MDPSARVEAGMIESPLLSLRMQEVAVDKGMPINGGRLGLNRPGWLAAGLLGA